ncbi:MAG: hypothetical protein OEY49_09555 [Candidatus Heimdallarchaeota archaeon]|nr:hypothetical protein [Candidatus Heimdallarchaeota archaeon]
MSILPIIERVETRTILSELLNEAKTAKELNDIIVLEKSICSTSTLYRRLSELVIGSFLTKDEEGKYHTTTLAKKVTTEIELIEKNKARVEKQHRKILYNIRDLSSQKTVSSETLYQTTKGSPNEIASTLKYLLHLGFIERKTINNKIGRPSYYYVLTDRGRRLLEDFDELKKEILRSRSENI